MNNNSNQINIDITPNTRIANFETQIPIPDLANIQPSEQKTIFRDFLEIISSSFLGAGIGYLFGSFVSLAVDLANNGFEEVRKRTEDEKLERYFNSNIYSVSGLSLGLLAGLSTYFIVSEIFRRNQEADFELQSVRQSINDNQINDFSGALSDRQQIDPGNGVTNGGDYGVSAEIFYENGPYFPRNHQPATILVLGGGNLNREEVFFGGLFDDPNSMRVSIDESPHLSSSAVIQVRSNTPSNITTPASVSSLQNIITTLASPRGGQTNPQAQEASSDLARLASLRLVSSRSLT